MTHGQVAALRRRATKLAGRVRAGGVPLLYVVSVPYQQPAEVTDAWLAAHGPRTRPCDRLVLVTNYADPVEGAPRLAAVHPLAPGDAAECPAE